MGPRKCCALLLPGLFDCLCVSNKLPVRVRALWEHLPSVAVLLEDGLPLVELGVLARHDLFLLLLAQQRNLLLAVVVRCRARLALLLVALQHRAPLPPDVLCEIAQHRELAVRTVLENAQRTRDAHALLALKLGRDAVEDRQALQGLHTALCLARDHATHRAPEQLCRRLLVILAVVPVVVAALAHERHQVHCLFSKM